MWAVGGRVRAGAFVLMLSVCACAPGGGVVGTATPPAAPAITDTVI